jgi:hypothetical protein
MTCENFLNSVAHGKYNIMLQIYVFSRFFLIFRSIFFEIKRFLFLLNVTLAWHILFIISFLNLPSVLIVLPKYMKYSTCFIVSPSFNFILVLMLLYLVHTSIFVLHNRIIKEHYLCFVNNSK